MRFSIQQLYRKQVLIFSLLFALLLAIGLVAGSYLMARNATKHALTLQAATIARQLVLEPVITEAEARGALTTATVNSGFNYGCVLGLGGTTYAVLHANAKETGTQCAAPAHNWQSVVARAVIADPNLPSPVGEVLLVAVMPSVTDYALFWLGVSIGLTAVVWLLGWLFGRRLEKAIVKPLRQIASTAQRVSLYKDYSLRVTPSALSETPQEVEQLTDSFNAMLDEIEDRDKRLTRKSEELEKSRHAAVAANNAKSQFLANVSHELRTPLNAIIGFSTMLQQEQFGPLGNDKYSEYARDIHDSGRHLLDVINDILDLSKAETGTLSVTIESLNLPKIIEKALHIVAAQAHERKIDIYTDLAEKLPKLFADRVRVMQILLNLLSNAIKFTPEGGKVIIRARAEKVKQQVHYFTLEIEDNGIGMSEADIAKAFQTFNQADAGLNRRYEGAGLGLPLTKRLVELHHGKIKITSAEGRGTIVTVRLTSDPALMP